MGVVILLGVGELLGEDSAAGSGDDIVSVLFLSLCDIVLEILIPFALPWYWMCMTSWSVGALCDDDGRSKMSRGATLPLPLVI